MAELTWRGKNTSIEQYDHAAHATPAKRLTTIETFNLLNNLSAQTISQPPQPPQSSQPSSTASWFNRLISGDKNAVLPALLPEFAQQIDLIYIDPPFMTGRNFTSGSQLAYHDTWNRDVDTYLQWLYETFCWLHRLLAEHGSLYVHLDWRAIHYARVMLDEIFGLALDGEGPGFKSEIIWQYQSGGRSQKHFARKHDTILLYTKSARYCFHPERIGERRGTNKRNHMRKQVGADGRVAWTIRSAGRLYTYDEDTLMTPSDVWSDISHLQQKDPERNGYATQKPEALLERIILASSEVSDIVLDCFCGSGVTPVVAQRLGRRWIASDQSELAIEVTQQRLLTHPDPAPFVLQHCIE
ncbi:MAG TPA: site-specific DNA-methyltransferase [Ktedonobacteraceae bacterium]|nr:site-specific DNA-methyltransferase [Ktedonobacteraceae bacterium]